MCAWILTQYIRFQNPRMVRPSDGGEGIFSATKIVTIGMILFILPFTKNLRKCLAQVETESQFSMISIELEVF